MNRSLEQVIRVLEADIRSEERPGNGKGAGKGCSTLKQISDIQTCVDAISGFSSDVNTKYSNCLVSSHNVKDIIACISDANDKIQGLDAYLEKHPECNQTVCEYDPDHFENWKIQCIVEATTEDKADKCIQGYTHHAKPKPTTKPKQKPKMKMKPHPKAKAKSKATGKGKHDKKSKTHVVSEKEVQKLKKMFFQKVQQLKKEKAGDTIVVPQAGTNYYNN